MKLTKTSLAIALVVSSSSVFAGGNHKPSSQGGFSQALGFGIGAAKSQSASAINVVSSPSSSSISQGGSATINYTAPSVPVSQTIRYKGIPKRTPDVVMSNVQATSNCRNPINAGGAISGLALAFGITYEDETCIAGEAMRIGAATNKPSLIDAGERILLLKLSNIEQKYSKKRSRSGNFGY